VKGVFYRTLRLKHNYICVHLEMNWVIFC